MTSFVEVTAPSRLHFGLLSFGNPAVPQFGGVGVMLEKPDLCLQIVPAGELSVEGPRADRVLSFVRRWAEFQQLPLQQLTCRIRVLRLPREHVGLGTGTQTALATAAGLNRWLELPPASPQQLAISVDRARRSAVGTYGFHFGGLIAEAGHFPSGLRQQRPAVGELIARHDLPAAWRVALVSPTTGRGLSGLPESQAFAMLPPVPLRTTDRLRGLLGDRIVPAVVAGNFVEFSQAVFEYGYLSGECFASCQGGPYASATLASMVQAIRQAGFAGVGQSSWGPTLYVWLASQQQAAEFQAWFEKLSLPDRWELLITPADNSGAVIIAS